MPLAFCRRAPTRTAGSLYLRCQSPSASAEIPLIHDSILADHKGQDPGRLVLGGVCDQSQSCVCLGAAAPLRCGVCSHDSKVVSVEWGRLLVAGIGGCGRDQALDEFYNKIFAGLSSVAVIFFHCEFLAHVNCRRLIFSDSAEQDLLLTAIRIEIPPTVRRDQGKGKGPVFCSDV